MELPSTANKLWVAFVQTLFKVNVNTEMSNSLPLGTQSLCITHSEFNTQSSASLKLSSNQKREPPSKASSMQVTTLWFFCCFLVCLLFIISRETHFVFFLPAHQEKVYKTALQDAQPTHEKFWQTLWPWHTVKMQSCFPFPFSSVTGTPSYSTPKNFSRRVFFLFWAHCLSPKYTMGTRERPSTDSSSALLYCLCLRGSNYIYKAV